MMIKEILFFSLLILISCGKPRNNVYEMHQYIIFSNYQQYIQPDREGKEQLKLLDKLNANISPNYLDSLKTFVNTIIQLEYEMIDLHILNLSQDKNNKLDFTRFDSLLIIFNKFTNNSSSYNFFYNKESIINYQIASKNVDEERFAFFYLRTGLRATSSAFYTALFKEDFDHRLLPFLPGD